MPVPAPLEPRGPKHVPGTVHHRRRYTDALGNPLRGTVTIINRNRLTPAPGAVVPPSSSPANVVDGWLDVHLPPGTYQFKAQLTGRDGGPTFVDDDTVTIREP